MPRSNLCKPQAVNLEAKEKAHELYTSMAIPKMAEIARRVGVHRKTISDWCEKEGWMDERDSLLKERRLKFQEQLGNPIDRISESLDICTDLKQAIKATAASCKRAGSQNPHKLKEATLALKELTKLEKELLNQSKEWSNYFH